FLPTTSLKLLALSILGQYPKAPWLSYLCSEGVSLLNFLLYLWQFLEKGSVWSCTRSLRIIAPPRKPATMPPYHPMVSGLCHYACPVLLPARGFGPSVVMGYAAHRLAQPRRRGPAEASRGGTHQAQADTLPRAPTVGGPDTQTALCPVCARS